ncbi:10899_t:CDS:2, partial [Racocetra fulgida]
MVSIAILGCDNNAFYLVSHLLYHNYNPQQHPDNNNKILLVGHQDPFHNLDSSEKIVFKTFDGLEMVIPRGQVNYTTDTKKVVDFNPDFVLVTLKGTRTIEVLKDIVNLDGKTVIVSMQEGILNSDIISVILPNTKIIEGLILQKISSSQNCHFVQDSSDGVIILQSTPDSLKLQQIFYQSELLVRLCSNLKNVMYGQLILKLGNALVYLSGLSFDEYVKDKTWRRIHAYCQWEAFEVFKRHGIDPVSAMNSSLPLQMIPYLLMTPDWILRPVLDNIFKQESMKFGINLMSQDFNFRNKLEIDDLQGEIVRLGGSGGLTTVYNNGILRLVKLVKPDWKVGIDAVDVLAYIENG